MGQGLWARVYGPGFRGQFQPQSLGPGTGFTLVVHMVEVQGSGRDPGMGHMTVGEDHVATATLAQWL